MQELKLPAVIESIPKLTAWMDEALEKLDCPMKAQMQLDVAMDEIFSNIARHSGPSGTDTVTVRFIQENDPKAVRIEISDTTRPFDPLSAADPDLAAPARKRKIGGLGLFMVKNLMDGIEYEYRDGLNILTVRKFL